MTQSQTKQYERVNVTLPPQTLRLIDRVAKKGNRSRLIDEAVRFYVQEKGRVNLRNELRLGAIARKERDQSLAEEWFRLDA